MRTKMMQMAAATLAMTTLPAWAHPGHGVPGGSHWHVGDAVGLIALVAAIGACAWLARRK